VKPGLEIVKKGVEKLFSITYLGVLNRIIEIPER